MPRKKINVKHTSFLLKLILVFFILLFLIKIGSFIIFESSFFHIQEVKTNIKEANFNYFIGKNIWKINLEKEYKILEGIYPECSNLRVFKLFPNQLYIDCTKRKPLAKVYIKGTYFYIDEEAFLFHIKNIIDDYLPVIRGLEKYFSPLQLNISYKSKKEIILCLEMIKKINLFLKNYRPKELIFFDINDIKLFLNLEELRNRTLEIRLNEDQWLRKIQLLNIIIPKIEDKENIKYIDLRFKDPIIKLNE